MPEVQEAEKDDMEDRHGKNEMDKTAGVHTKTLNGDTSPQRKD